MTNETYTSPLTRALARWKQGYGISLTLAAELLAEGYDVQALERRHQKIGSRSAAPSATKGG